MNFDRERGTLKAGIRGFSTYLHGDKSVPPYSATRQQAEMLPKRIGKPKEGKEHPLILRRDAYRANTKLTPYWLKNTNILS